MSARRGPPNLDDVAGGPAKRRVHGGDLGGGADAVGFPEPSHGLGELPGLDEIGNERSVSHARMPARYIQLVRFSFLIMISRFVTLSCNRFGFP